MMKFDWDDAKERSNIRKHGIDFKTASLVFLDPCVFTRQDRIENGEYRWQTIGVVNGYHMLLVAHTAYEQEENTEVIRIISARKANKSERKRYEQNNSL